jgi:hypothetical protein
MYILSNLWWKIASPLFRPLTFQIAFYHGLKVCDLNERLIADEWLTEIEISEDKTEAVFHFHQIQKGPPKLGPCIYQLNFYVQKDSENSVTM